MTESSRFLIVFFVGIVPSAIIACNLNLKLPIWVRLVAIGNFLLSVFIIIRVYVFGVSEYRIFVF